MYLVNNGDVRDSASTRHAKPDFRHKVSDSCHCNHQERRQVNKKYLAAWLPKSSGNGCQHLVPPAQFTFQLRMINRSLISIDNRGPQVDGDGPTMVNFSRFCDVIAFTTKRERLLLIASIIIVDSNKLGNIGGLIVSEVRAGYNTKNTYISM